MPLIIFIVSSNAISIIYQLVSISNDFIIASFIFTFRCDFVIIGLYNLNAIFNVRSIDISIIIYTSIKLFLFMLS